VAKVASPPDPKVLVAHLRKALAGPTLLQGDGDSAMFPKGAKGKPLIDLAVAEGYLHTTKMPVEVPGKKKPTIKQVDHGVLTEAGRKFIFDMDDPKQILESLLPALEKLGTPEAPKNDGLASEIQKITETLEKQVNDAIEKQKAEWTKATDKVAKIQEDLLKKFDGIKETLATKLASATPQASIDPKPVLDAITETLKRVETPIVYQTPATPSPTPAIAGSDKKAIEDAITTHINAQPDDSLGVRFDNLWDVLLPKFPDLTSGQFQDALRNLNLQKIRLTGWSGIIDEMPKPELGFFISSKVIYYAHRYHSHG